MSPAAASRLPRQRMVAFAVQMGVVNAAAIAAAYLLGRQSVTIVIEVEPDQETSANGDGPEHPAA